MAPKSKAKKATASSDDSENESPVVDPTPAKQVNSDPTRVVFGVDLDDPRDVEDDENAVAPVAKYAILAMICLMSFSIRLFAVVRYESVIHEFDPYFNFRTTKYLASEGFLEFLDWFDDRAWYPLGRIIGGTIYPGLMYTAALVYWVLNLLNISINVRNTCVFLAPLFAANTAIASYLLTKEVTKRSSAGLLAAAFAGIVPSYISRSVGGSYDNEGVAIFALIFVFYLWIKAVHTGSMFWSAGCALTYFYMVAAWGGYVFIINMIPIYVLVMIFAGRYTPRLYIAYSTFYTLGSLMAMQVPFVGFNVIKQAECAGSHGVFVLLQVYCFVNWLRNYISAASFRRLILVGAGLLVSGVALALLVLQLMGKVQWTGRSLTLLDPTYASKYIPIIASVSEHQPTTWTSYFFDLHILVPFAPVGLYFLFQNLTDGGIFVILYGTVAWYFAGVMVRLMLTLAPIACILGAVGISSTLRKFMGILARPSTFVVQKDGVQPVPKILALGIVSGLLLMLLSYTLHATYVSSMAYSSPSIVIEAGRTQTGERVNFDDYREAYFWLRQNTDANAKIMSWWDYGYQMSAMANRTVIVDNNTWNNTHIATVGRALASSEEDAYPILQSLDVDYVLVIFGGVTGYSSDDINKFLWACAYWFGCLCYYRFGEVMTDYQRPPGFDRARNTEVGVKNIKLTHLEEAFTSEHWIVRIFKVKKQPNVESTTAVKKARLSEASAAENDISKEKTRFLGCSTGEDMLGNDRVYAGGPSGANFNLALHHAKEKGKRYFAVARVAGEGHAFAFNKLPVSEADLDGNDEGCMRACKDTNSHSCGCADAGCTDMNVAPGKGQEHNRRWAIYERQAN
ncbi:dolichyl-diphosphooligosaccharide-protein glycosyltransferase subunit STT3A, putative [Phytophthora infestans T30-4]|uniref:dolichyl-diphosphooligosaccharide--protein glycotransferase n=1 Tax=Phytophthora infestans (strain T30-4) TaxID=403677 RepID=D0MRA6_PHYIT|nr:dolichyl-diphosphooligosaccharide-protein glycosyltransferase subunit STT3A, putative [Phytophthora infestans T30-4]EEY58025.1 dolichyl-diphosphooligosaccharide-protein glycosyltransferase subunit STT3A, putative [Phytophthora infestans T30-4]|eukprot:XP_002909211.1 dolichyl-diphosphooligosaccharide-protein glycosyltransferase subunit STT3A, putative [Phytophthora infestans T30-4]